MLTHVQLNFSKQFIREFILFLQEVFKIPCQFGMVLDFQNSKAAKTIWHNKTKINMVELHTVRHNRILVKSRVKSGKSKGWSTWLAGQRKQTNLIMKPFVNSAKLRPFINNVQLAQTLANDRMGSCTHLIYKLLKVTLGEIVKIEFACDVNLRRLALAKWKLKKAQQLQFPPIPAAKWTYFSYFWAGNSRLKVAKVGA